MQGFVLLVPLFVFFGKNSEAQRLLENYPSGLNFSANLKQTSTKCQKQFTSIDTLTLAQMVDSTAKLPTGLLALNFFNLGNFVECYSIETYIPDESVYGQYCLGTIPFHISPEKFTQQRVLQTEALMRNFGAPRMLGGQGLMGYHHGFCVPSGCTPEDLNNLTGNTMTFLEQYCYSKALTPGLGSGAIAAIFFLSLFLLILVVSTVYDVVSFYRKQRPAHDILIAFSAFANGQKLLKSTQDPEQLLCLNGIKAITMTWIMLAHEYMLSTNGPIINFIALGQMITNKENMFITGSSVSVDSFLTVGGLVTTYVFLRSADKGVKFNILLYYLHRYIRLTPALAVVVLFHSTLLKHIRESPMWGGIDEGFVTNCQDYWWSTILYLQNIFHAPETCLPQSWYLSVDFQIFLLSPLVLFPLKKWPKYGLALLGTLIVAGILVPFAITYDLNLVQFGAPYGDRKKNMWYYYKQTHTRFGPYVIGMLVGYVIYRFKKNGTKPRLNPIAVIALWIICMAVLVTCVYSIYDVMNATEYNVWDNALINGFLRQSWSLALSGIILMCIFGYGGPINLFLSSPIFQFLTKLSYCMYLTHYGIIGARYGLTTLPYYFSHQNMMWNFWGDYVLTLAISILLCLTFESPMITIERIILRRSKIQQETGKHGEA